MEIFGYYIPTRIAALVGVLAAAAVVAALYFGGAISFSPSAPPEDPVMKAAQQAAANAQAALRAKGPQITVKVIPSEEVDAGRLGVFVTIKSKQNATVLQRVDPKSPLSVYNGGRGSYTVTPKIAVCKKACTAASPAYKLPRILVHSGQDELVTITVNCVRASGPSHINCARSTTSRTP
jgi:hypothetical protein